MTSLRNQVKTLVWNELSMMENWSLSRYENTIYTTHITVYFFNFFEPRFFIDGFELNLNFYETLIFSFKSKKLRKKLIQNKNHGQFSKAIKLLTMEDGKNEAT